MEAGALLLTAKLTKDGMSIRRSGSPSPMNRNATKS